MIDTLDGYLLKKEACEFYNRSLRQLARDFDKALARGDSKFIGNFKLRLEDGTVLEAHEVDKDQIQRFRDKGLNPTWYVNEAWMDATYGRRGDVSEQVRPRPHPESIPPEPPPTVSPSGALPEILKSKDELIDVLREENQYLRDALTDERKRSTDDRELTKQLHILLKNMQDRLLPSPDHSRSLSNLSPSPKESVVEGNIAVETKSRPVSAKRPRPLRNSPQPKKGNQPSTDGWMTTHMPTFKRIFSRR